MIQLSDEATRRSESTRAAAESKYWEEERANSGNTTQRVEELATEFLHVVFFSYVSEYFKTDAGPAEIRISVESTLTSLVNDLIPSPKWPLPQQELHRDEMMTVTASSRSTWTPAPTARVLDRNEIVEAKRAQVRGSIMQSAEWREFQARLREWKQAPDSARPDGATAPRAQCPKRRGRPTRFTPQQINTARDMKRDGKRNNEIAKVLYKTNTPTAEQRRSVPTTLRYHSLAKK